MRWFYAVPGDAEHSARSRVEEQIRKFWTAFNRDAPKLANSFERTNRQIAPEWMEEHFSPIHSNLEWEFGPALRTKGHRLTITTSNISTRPLVHRVIREARPPLGWEFYPYHPATNPEYAATLVRSRTGFALEDPRFIVSLGKGHTVDVDMLLPYYPSDPELAREVGYIALQMILGEEAVHHWLGDFKVSPTQVEVPFSGPASERVTAADFANRFGVRVSEILESLPKAPYYARPRGEAMVSQGTKVFDPELWFEMHQRPRRFYSCRYSRHEEVFAFLRIVGDADEEALHDQLTRSQIGCVLAVVVGEDGPLIDLALVDVPGAMRVIRDIVKSNGWLYFGDEDLGCEWIGIRDNLVPPP